MALNTAATFDVFSRLEVPNDGLLQTFFESAPNGSDHINVLLFCIVVQTGFSQFMVVRVVATTLCEIKSKS